MDWTIVGTLFDKTLTACGKLFDWLGKGTLDKTEIAKARLELEKIMAQLEFSKQQMQIWVQQALIDMEKATGAKWRTPLILITGIGLVVVCINNIVAYTYIPTAKIISLASPEMGVLVGLFVLLVVGDAKLLLEVFNGRNKPAGDNNSPAKKEGE